MPEYKKLRRIIESLARDWISHCGVVNISYEKMDGKMCVIFHVKSSELKNAESYYNYPREVQGYSVVIEPVKD
jgi:hypothetical protein